MGSPVIKGARYVHTNLVSRDWRKLAAFYAQQFGCTVVPPERHFSGPEIEAGTGLPRAAFSGVHLRLPGHGENGPTLEIFTYTELGGNEEPAPNRLGYGHLAFQVHSVPEARAQVLEAGGSAVGEVVRVTTAAGVHVTWFYVTDPEGNILELQSIEEPGCHRAT